MRSSVPDVVAGHRRAQFAVDAVRSASLLVRRVQRELAGRSLTKNDKSPVTVADFAAQALVAERLTRFFPGAATDGSDRSHGRTSERLVGEENAAPLAEASGAETLAQVARFVEQEIPGATPAEVCRWIDLGDAEPSANERPSTAAANSVGRIGFWTLDPVDGTKGFLRNDQYAVALAYIESGRVQLGALGCPELSQGDRPERGGPQSLAQGSLAQGLLALAVRGHGAWIQDLDAPLGTWRRLTASREARPSQARVLRSVESGHTDAQGVEALINALAIEAAFIPMDSQAKYAVLAAGGGEALVRLLSPSRPDYREKIWDQAAGSIVVEEAGGRVTDLDGKPLDFSHGRTLAANRGVLATNGLLHEAFLRALRQVGA